MDALKRWDCTNLLNQQALHPEKGRSVAEADDAFHSQTLEKIRIYAGIFPILGDTHKIHLE